MERFKAVAARALKAAAPQFKVEKEGFIEGVPDPEEAFPSPAPAPDGEAVSDRVGRRLARALQIMGASRSYSLVPLKMVRL